jgi:hypothetical protein
MDKPDRVEVGQWWRGPEIGIMRLEHNAGAGYDWLLGSCSGAEYLGSGPNPEPSEWMIETLAEHAYDIGRARLPPTWGDYPDEKQTNWRYCVRRTLSGECDVLNEQLTDAVLSLYSILRSLGKW